MKKVLRRLRRSSKIARTLWFLLSLGFIISFIFFAVSIISLTGIETLTRYFVLVYLLVYLLFYLYESLCCLVQRKYKFFYFMSFITFIMIAIFSVGSYVIDKGLDTLSLSSEKDEVKYTSYLITMSNTTLNAKSTLGMIDDTEDIEGNILAKEIIDQYELDYKVEMYDNSEGNAYYDMLYDLYDHKIDGIFVSSNYVTLFSGEEDFINIAEDTKVVYKTSKLMKNKDKKIKSSDKKLTEPFTALIMGVDSEYDGLNANAAFNGDTLILITFNPNTLNATMFSLPRDIYVPIACRGGRQAKINSSAASGSECVINTIQNLTGITIDYYIKINFKGVVDLVDAVGGVTVDVEEPDYYENHGNYCGGVVCEQDSKRRWGEYTRYITPGVQNLNGEDALAYARCRGVYIESDIARNRHQQDIISALAQKVAKLESLSDFQKVLDAISNNISTNMSTDQILSSYKILKGMVQNVINDEDFISIEKTKLQVYSLPVYVPNTGNYTSALGYFEDSLNDIVRVMKINLELEEPEIQKSMKYSLNETYETYVAGEGITGNASNDTLDSYISGSKEEAKAYCEKEHLQCSFSYIDESSPYYDASIGTDRIAFQDPHAGTLIKNVSEVHFYIIGASKKENNTNKENTKEKETEKESEKESEKEEVPSEKTKEEETPKKEE